MSASLALRFVATPHRLAVLQRKLGKVMEAAPVVSTHSQLYFDTSGTRLRRLGFDLRLERREAHWVQLMRCRKSGEEWQAPYVGGFDFSQWNDASLDKRLNRVKLRNHLIRVFDVRLRRSVWQGKTGLSVLLERGAVASGARSTPFARLTLRGPHADREPLFDLAAQLSETVALLPEDDDVVARGYLLLAGHDEAPARAAALDLADDASAREAFAHIATACLSHWIANRDGAVKQPDDPEYVHQLRVAIRRLRAAIQVFRTVLPEEFLAAALPPLRELMASLGRSRDLDVLMQEIVSPVANALPDEPRLQALNERLIERLLQARRQASTQLDRPALGSDLIKLTRQIEALRLESPSPAIAEVPLREFVDQRLRKRLRAAQRCAEAARNDDPVSLHDLRIAIKRLRYSLEFFSSLLPDGMARKVLRKLAVLQDELGQLNDLASAGALLMANAGDEAPLREAVTLIAGWHGARYARLLADIPHHLDDVRGLRLPRLSPKVKAVKPIEPGSEPSMPPGVEPTGQASAPPAPPAQDHTEPAGQSTPSAEPTFLLPPTLD